MSSNIVNVYHKFELPFLKLKSNSIAVSELWLMTSSNITRKITQPDRSVVILNDIPQPQHHLCNGVDELNRTSSKPVYFPLSFG